MKLTAQMIHEASTGNGGWNMHQLARLGVSWPPVSGWIDRVQGMEISETDYGIFKKLGEFRKQRDREMFLKSLSN